MSMGGGSSQQTTTTTEPWDEQKPYLEKGFSEAEQLYNQGPQEYFPGQTYVDQSPETQAGLSGATLEALNQAGGGNASGAAQNYITDTLSGGGDNPYEAILGSGTAGLQDTASGAFLNSNPYLDATFDASASRLTDQFNDSILPNIGAQFGMSGGAGSALHQELATKAGGQLTDSLGSLAADIYGGNYANERGLMQDAQGQLTSTGANLYGTGVNEKANAAGMAPGIDTAQFNPWQQLTDIGGQQEAFGERQLEDQINRHNFEQNAELQSLQDYMSMITGNYGGTSTSMASGGSGSGLATGLGAMSTLASAFL